MSFCIEAGAEAGGVAVDTGAACFGWAWLTAAATELMTDMLMEYPPPGLSTSHTGTFTVSEMNYSSYPGSRYIETKNSVNSPNSSLVILRGDMPCEAAVPQRFGVVHARVSRHGEVGGIQQQL